ncbi:hypothetical protein AA15669_1097 [Saccharibacter floricola DSM 15669]|uniref:Uncharacterized protein n=1 Tax=Saccharibacter floricola DSM 15669 TaxID=1123227 RepID=A0ABQ0NYR8_9PROT|nr:hypothetical protein AA15669_1097 [Saccharibacter floricola DSM 15669]
MLMHKGGMVDGLFLKVSKHQQRLHGMLRQWLLPNQSLWMMMAQEEMGAL